MARVFTISFTYNEKDYTAVISEAQGSITIYIPDEDLQSMLPSSKLKFHPEKGVETDTPLNEKAKHLVRISWSKRKSGWVNLRHRRNSSGDRKSWIGLASVFFEKFTRLPVQVFCQPLFLHN